MEISNTMISERIQALNKQREEAVTTIIMIDGALHVLKGLLEETTNQPDSGKAPVEPASSGVG